jgi:hypothetical protein
MKIDVLKENLNGATLPKMEATPDAMNCGVFCDDGIY